MLGVSTVVIITLEVVNYISCTDLYATPMSMSWVCCVVLWWDDWKMGWPIISQCFSVNRKQAQLTNYEKSGATFHSTNE